MKETSHVYKGGQYLKSQIPLLCDLINTKKATVMCCDSIPPPGLRLSLLLPKPRFAWLVICLPNPNQPFALRIHIALHHPGGSKAQLSITLCLRSPILSSRFIGNTRCLLLNMEHALTRPSVTCVRHHTRTPDSTLIPQNTHTS